MTVVRSQPDTRARGARVPVEEPRPPRRIRRPVDLARLLLGCALVAGCLLLGNFAISTTTGIGTDIAGAADRIPTLVARITPPAITIAALALPAAVAVGLALRRQFGPLLDALAAAIVAVAVTSGVGHLLVHLNPERLLQTLTRDGAGGTPTAPTATYLAGLAAFLTIVGVANRRARLRASLATFTVVVATALIVGVSTPLALLLTLLLGWTVAVALRWAVGATNVRPPGSAVMSALRTAGVEPIAARLVLDEDAGTRCYQVETVEHGLLDVMVLDADQQGAGVLYRLYRKVRLRKGVQRRPTTSVRHAMEHETLVAYAAERAGVATPTLVTVCEISQDAVLLAYTHSGARTIDTLDDDELSDDLLRQAWRQLGTAHAHRLAHRALTGDHVAVDDAGRVLLVEWGDGEVAASDLQLQLDVAQLLCTFALRVGVERTVATALTAIGPTVLADALPLLQPVALSRDTRAELRQPARRGLLHRLRNAVAEVTPQTDVQFARLERLRPRTVFSLIAGALAAYVLLTQLGQVDLLPLLRDMKWEWAAAGFALSALSYVAAAMNIAGFAPHRLPPGRTFLAQLAASFVTLITPAAVGGVAVNARFVQRTGVEPALAVASVGVAQVFALVVHVAMLAGFAVATGASKQLQLPGHGLQYALIGVAAVLAVVGLMLVLPIGRQLLLARVRPMLGRIGPQIVDVLSSPRRLALGMGGAALLSLANIAALDCAIRAFGGHVPFTGIAVVYLAGSAIGSAAPTPGGLGAVEAALAAGLGAFGLEGALAVSAVLLYRTLTFWLPVVPGWIAFTFLQRKDAL